MIPLNHNGGPPVFDVHPDDRMYFAPMDIDDYLDGIAKLKPNAIGIYSIILFLMYRHMGSLRDDDRYIAGHCDCDVRTYQNIREKLIADKKLYAVDGYLYNNRALVEIAKFCATTARKRAAAAEREANKRAAAEAARKAEEEAAKLADVAAAEAARLAEDMAVADALQAESAQTLRKNGAERAQDLRTLAAKSAAEARKNCTPEYEKYNEINDRQTTAVVPIPHGRGSPLLQKEKEKEREVREVREDGGASPAAAGPSRSDAIWAFECWNHVALRCGLRQAAKMTPDRERNLIARMRDYGRDGWERAMRNVEQSAFLRGRNDRGWRADIDFVLQAKSFGKLHDGSYGNGAHAGGVTVTGDADALAAAQSALALARSIDEADHVE